LKGRYKAILLWIVILCSQQSAATTAAQKQTAIPIISHSAEPITFVAQTPVVKAVPTTKPIEIVYIGNKNTKEILLP